MFGIQTFTLLSNVQNFINSIKVYNLLPFMRIPTFNNPFNDNGSQLGKVNNMYRFSLAYFIKLFLTCLEDGSEKGKLTIAKKDTKDKLAEAEAALNQIIFNNIASSLFKVDRLTFALYLVRAISPEVS